MDPLAASLDVGRCGVTLINEEAEASAAPLVTLALKQSLARNDKVRAQLRTDGKRYCVG